MKSHGRTNHPPVPAKIASGSLSRVAPVVHEVLNSPGQPLDAKTNETMGSRFGHDFSKVRVHADGRAAEAAEALSSHAFTLGADIVFGLGQYSPATREGQKMLAHELTHVVQQDAGAASNELELNPSSHFEREADNAAEKVTTGGPGALAPQVSAAPPSIQRVAKWKNGKATPAFDLAEREVSGEPHAGQTFLMLNGQALKEGMNVTDALKALKTPTFKTTPNANGKGVECTFDTLPTNEATSESRVLKPGKWQAQTTKKKLAALFPKLKQCVKAGAGDAYFTIADNPDVTNNTQAHEQQHAKDDEATFNKIIVPWDKYLTDSKKGNLTGNEATDKDCQASLYGPNTPTQIMTDVINDINQRSKDFHNKPEGRDAIIFDVQSDDDCNAVRAKAK